PPLLQQVNLIVGDSFTAALQADELGRRGRRHVVNLSKGGSTIEDVSDQLDNFFVSNKLPVSKIFVSVGANDIRKCREKGVRHLKSPLNKLSEKIKNQFPSASVWFQSLIPLPHQHPFSEANVVQFNNLLYEICTKNHIFYLDCFNSFLTYDGFRLEYLFFDFKNIHPNKKGLSVLARIYLNIIHSKKFNPLGY
ncbi:MAG: SGNH/GDSL hydrolase family protein, partial [Moritella sp.]|uniref:SGNH/GDSL hydrolase family protein n=1 Tax=Moritella sp. TaxID=78556 RepID=UPI001E111462